MAENKENKAKNRRLTQNLIVLFIIVTTILVLAEIGTHVANEVATRQEQAAIGEELSRPTQVPVPTLTDAERQEILRAPVGEEGNE